MFCKLYDVLLYELSDPAGASVTLTELDGQSGQLGDKPAQAVIQGSVTVDPPRLKEHTLTTHPVLRRYSEIDQLTVQCSDSRGYDSCYIEIAIACKVVR